MKKRKHLEIVAGEFKGHRLWVTPEEYEGTHGIFGGRRVKRVR